MKVITQRLPQVCPNHHNDHVVITPHYPGDHNFPTLTQHRCAARTGCTGCDTPLGWESRIPKLLPFSTEPKFFTHGSGLCDNPEVLKAMAAYRYRSVTIIITVTAALIATIPLGLGLFLYDQQPTHTIYIPAAFVTTATIVIATAFFSYRRFKSRPPAPNFAKNDSNLSTNKP